MLSGLFRMRAGPLGAALVGREGVCLEPCCRSAHFANVAGAIGERTGRSGWA